MDNVVIKEVRVFCVVACKHCPYAIENVGASRFEHYGVQCFLTNNYINVLIDEVDPSCPLPRLEDFNGMFGVASTGGKT